MLDVHTALGNLGLFNNFDDADAELFSGVQGYGYKAPYGQDGFAIADITGSKVRLEIFESPSDELSHYFETNLDQIAFHPCAN